jgi:hypothetical protein
VPAISPPSSTGSINSNGSNVTSTTLVPFLSRTQDEDDFVLEQSYDVEIKSISSSELSSEEEPDESMNNTMLAAIPETESIPSTSDSRELVTVSQSLTVTASAEDDDKENESSQAGLTLTIHPQLQERIRQHQTNDGGIIFTMKLTKEEKEQLYAQGRLPLSD